MSLLTPAKPSEPSYRNLKLFTLNGSSSTSDNSVTSTQIFSSDKQSNNEFMSDSYSTETYEKYFLDEAPGPASSSTSASSRQQRVDSSFVAQMPLRDEYQENFVDDYFDNQTPNLDPANYDEAEMKLKLKELELALLGDNDLDETDQLMEIDGEWTETTLNSEIKESPTGSISSDSNVISKVQLSPVSLKQMLIHCAGALSEGNVTEASGIINELRGMVSIQGDPPQRIAAYMVEGLAARMAASGKYLYKALKCKEPPSSYRLAAMQILFEVCPCFKFGFMVANSAIIEAIKDEKEKTVHIIDFDINQGSQYITLIQTLARLRRQPKKSPKLRLTGVDDPESVQRDVGGLRMIGLRLEELAKDLDVPFEFRAVPAKTCNVTPSVLNLRAGEALVVNFAFQLHHMPDESVSTVNQRDELLRMVKSLNPKLVTVVEQNVNTNTSPFYPRFIEAYNYYSAVFDSLDATLPRESQDRMNVEKQCLARDIVNIVACEGEERIERYEVAGKWRARMMMAGFRSCPISPAVIDTVHRLIKQEYCDRYKMTEELGAVHFGWQDKSLIVASAWM